MTNIDASVKFVSINIALLTISDSRSENDDESGDLLNERITNFGHAVKKRLIIKEDVELIKQTFLDLSNDPVIDVIISTGGTGLTGRDSTPEAVVAIADKTIDGFGELFRQLSFNKIATSTIQSRAIGAVVNHTYVYFVYLVIAPLQMLARMDGMIFYTNIKKLDIRYRSLFNLS